MAGVKGRSGGARKGAGRKAKPAPKQVPVAGVVERLEEQAHGGALKRSTTVPVPASDSPDMLTLLQQVALGIIESTPLQVRAAIAAVQYTHTKRGDGGKKEEQDAKAKKAHGKFGAPVAPPRLVAVAGTKR